LPAAGVCSALFPSRTICIRLVARERAISFACSWAAGSLESRLGTDYCLSAPSSLDLHIGGNVVPQQVVVMSTKGSSGRVGWLRYDSIQNNLASRLI